MPKKRKDVTFDGDISKGGSSSGRVEDPNELANSNESPNSSDDVDKGMSTPNSDNENNQTNDTNNNNEIPENDNEENSESNKPYTETPNEQENSRVTDPSPQNVNEANGGEYTGNNDVTNEQATRSGNDENNGSDEANNVNDDADSSNSNDLGKNDNKTENENNDNNSVTDATEKEDKSFSSEDSEDSNKSGLIGKLTGGSEVGQSLQKAKKLKDLSEMSKEEATEELKSVAIDAGKMKLKAAIWTTISPYLLPIIGILLVLIIIFMMLIGILSSTSNDSDNKQEGCKTVESNTSDVKSSKDAEKNAKTIYDYEKKHVKGSTAKGRAAHLGNLYIESARTFDPKTIQGNNSFKESIAKDPSAGGYAFGIAQWDSERRVNLLKYAEKKDKKWSDFGIQLDFMLNHDGSDSELIKGLLKKDGDIKGITEDIMNDWERAGDKSSIGERQSAAAKYYSKFGSSDSDSDEDSNIDDATDAATDNSDASDNSGCNSDGDDGEDTDGNVGKSVKANGDSGEIKEKWSSKDEIPKKYKKYIKIPEFKDSFLEGSPFGTSTALKGQCTELTWAYMSAMWSGKQPTSGNGGDLHKSYKSAGAKVTSNPTVGYGFSSFPPYAGAGDDSVGHTGVVAGVLPDGKWILANYNLNLEAPDRKLTYALVDGNKKEGGVKFFSGIGDKKKKAK